MEARFARVVPASTLLVCLCFLPLGSIAKAAAGYKTTNFVVSAPTPQLAKEIGDQAASAGQRVLFYRGHIVIDALFSRQTAMSASELRQLAGMLPSPTGNTGSLPPILGFMPQREETPAQAWLTPNPGG